MSEPLLDWLPKALKHNPAKPLNIPGPVTAQHKHVVMFSSGAGSAMAGKRVADRYGTANLTLLFADVNGEHPDNYRFLHEAHEWIGGELVIIDNGGKTIWDVFREKRFLGNSRIDPCSRVLKREPMRKWLEDNCDPEFTVSYLGFDWTEEHRYGKAQGYWAPWRMEAPMLWSPALDKADGMARMVEAGILPPLLTRQGFPHANCGGGCVKAGAKQFKKLLKTAPETYSQWEQNEEDMRQFLGKDVSILRRQREGVRTNLTLRNLREEVEEDESAFSDADWGGCNCFTPPEEEEEETVCLFCSRQSEFVEGEVVAFKDKFPVTEGHYLIVPIRHCSDFFTMTDQERTEANTLLVRLAKQIQAGDATVVGFNVGINCGEAAGQTIDHAHMHLIPRRDGDTPFPRGGVRGVIPEKMSY